MPGRQRTGNYKIGGFDCEYERAKIVHQVISEPGNIIILTSLVEYRHPLYRLEIERPSAENQAVCPSPTPSISALVCPQSRHTIIQYQFDKKSST